ncbi:integumentary mucin C.1-like [Dreissena polymorpha]|uniref:EGF-like domain-containing protein n=1 Tax=Dreissena polymorpha TaxID=45954 RepID=A0A9D4DST3_DREPO|nr:integumentary mucin C.1-like [Dreissena polymorpha]KAH3754761.1 hypothetical protein DPMN_189442 [Dreissena polymorpha]
MALVFLQRSLMLVALLCLLCAARDTYSHGSSELNSTIVSMNYENENLITTTVDVFNDENIAFETTTILNTTTTATTTTTTPTNTTTNTTTTQESTTSNGKKTEKTTTTTTATQTTTTTTPATSITTTSTPATASTAKPSTTSTKQTEKTTETAPPTTASTPTTTTTTATTPTTTSTFLPQRTKYPVLNQTIEGGCPLGYELQEEEALGHVCMHQCESLTCENMGQCIVQIGDNMLSSAVCRCTEESDVVYSGPTCAERHMAPQRERAIILGVLITIVGLLLLIAVCACYSLKKHRHSFRHNHHDNNL